MNVQIPPNDNEAEMAVLSSMLFDKDAVITARETLQPDDFYNPSNAAIYEAMMDLFAANTPVDAVTLKGKMAEKGALERVGGLEYIAALAAGYFTSANAAYYAKIIERKSVLRKLIKASSEISAKSFEGRDEVETILDHAEKLIFDIAQSRRSQNVTSINDALVDAVSAIERVYLSKERITGIETGFADLDYKTAGLQPSDLVLIAARPSMGKTAFALNIAQHVAVRKRKSVVIFSLEMSAEQLVNRMLCSEAHVDAQKVKTGDLSDSDWKLIVDSIGPLSKARIYIDDTPAADITEIRAKCRRIKIENGLDLVIIDYLQLMSGRSKAESRQQEISEISRSLKALARELRAPVVALSQLSRACETRADHRPMLSDLRESGAIEQDADVVAFLYRDKYYNPDTELGDLTELIIAKQRNGPTGAVHLMWIDKCTRFESVERRPFN
ncbi:MAG: replicative DNA helicase [Clostridiales bacterium]|nr:replicative DNA helicase [Clostridiales bacterium]